MLNYKKILLAAIAGVLSVGSAAIPVHAENNDFAIVSNGQTTKLPASKTGNENVSDILGDAQYFGITANEWSFNGEAESSMAVKKFTHQGGSGGQTGVTDKAEGSTHGQSIIGSVDSPFMIKGVGETIVTPESEKEKFTNSTSGKLDFEIKTEDEINAKIDDMLAHASGESKRLASLDSISDYSVIPSNQMTIDVTSADTNTVYIKVAKNSNLENVLKQSSGLTIKKNPGQVVVLNFEGSDININKLEIEQNGQKYGGDSLANVSTAKNPIASELIFNMPNATHAELHNVTGIVLATSATIDTYDVTGGWFVTDKVINHCEHHFTNGKLPTSLDVFQKETPKPADTPEPTKEPEPTTEPTEKPTPTEEPVKPELKKAKFRVHAFRVKNNVAKPEENLKIDITKTDYNIPEKEQNESDKEDTRTSDDIKVGDVTTLTTNSEGNTETELDKGSYKVEAKRENAPIVEKADQTTIYVHSDAKLTGNAIEDENKFVVKQIEETKPDIPEEKPEAPIEQPVQPEETEETVKPTEAPVPAVEPAKKPSQPTVTPEVKEAPKQEAKPSEMPLNKPAEVKKAVAKPVNQVNKAEDAKTGIQSNPAAIYGTIALAAAAVLIAIIVGLKKKAE